MKNATSNNGSLSSGMDEIIRTYENVDPEHKKDAISPDANILESMLRMGYKTGIDSQKEKTKKEIKQLLEALEQHCKILNIIIRDMREGVVVVNHAGDCILFNVAAQEILGPQITELSASEWLEHFTIRLPDRRKYFKPGDLPLQKALEGDHTRGVKMYVKSPDFPVGLHIKMNASPLHDSEGYIIGAIAIFTDLTDQKKADDALKQALERQQKMMNDQFLMLDAKVKERTAALQKANAALAESERKYRILVDNALVGIFKTRLNGEILYINKPVAYMYGANNVEEVYRIKSFLMYKNPDDRKRYIEKLLQHGKVDSFEFEILTKYGETKTVVVSATLTGDIISGVLVDVTQRKQTEALLERANTKLNQKNHQITQSIEYAKNIQESILPEVEDIKKAFSDAFILYMPRDIVSGDFYWYFKDPKENCLYLAAVDCTGHGVPGAFMSMLGHELMEHIIIEKGIAQPREILTELDRSVIKILKQKKTTSVVQDGMNMTLCRLDQDRHQLTVASSRQTLFMIRDKNLIEFKSSTSNIGGHFAEGTKGFTQETIDIREGDQFYLSSDGYVDQFGGPRDKKFLKKRFVELLLKVHEKPASTQQFFIRQTIENWKGVRPQTDDILVMGFKI